MSAVCKAECGLFTGSLDPKAFGRMPGSSNTLDRLVCVGDGEATCDARASAQHNLHAVGKGNCMCTPVCIRPCSVACAARWGAPSHPLHAGWARGCAHNVACNKCQRAGVAPKAAALTLIGQERGAASEATAGASVRHCQSRGPPRPQFPGEQVLTQRGGDEDVISIACTLEHRAPCAHAPNLAQSTRQPHFAPLQIPDGPGRAVGACCAVDVFQVLF